MGIIFIGHLLPMRKLRHRELCKIFQESKVVLEPVPNLCNLKAHLINYCSILIHTRTSRNRPKHSLQKFNGGCSSILEKEMATHSSTLAWKIPWMRSLVGYIVRGISKSQTWPSDFTFTFHFHALEKEMATYSSVLAWRIPGTGEPSELPCLEAT